MKLPWNSILYLASAGMLGLAGWQAYEAQYGAEPIEAVRIRGTKVGKETVQLGFAALGNDSSWDYHGKDWWLRFETVNITGKVEVPPEQVKIDEPDETEQVAVIAKPLDEIFEIVGILYDGTRGAEDESNETGVTVRYVAPDVEIPEHLLPAGAGGAPRDVMAMPINKTTKVFNGKVRSRGGAVGKVPNFSQPGDEVVHALRIGEGLWPPYNEINLKMVHDSAEFAVFSRPTADENGNTTGQREDEKAYKPIMGLTTEVSAWLTEQRLANRADGDSEGGRAPVVAGAGDASKSTWVDVDETRMVKDGQWSISRKDQDSWSAEPERLLSSFSLRPYVSSSSGRRGLQISNPDPKLAGQFGVRAGDVLLEINGQPVRSKAQALSYGKKLYQRGVRRFEAKFLSNGREEIRYYDVPEK